MLLGGRARLDSQNIYFKETFMAVFLHKANYLMNMIKTFYGTSGKDLEHNINLSEMIFYLFITITLDTMFLLFFSLT